MLNYEEISTKMLKNTQITVCWWPTGGPPVVNPLAHRRFPPVGHRVFVRWANVGPPVEIRWLKFCNIIIIIIITCPMTTFILQKYNKNTVCMSKIAK